MNTDQYLKVKSEARNTFATNIYSRITVYRTVALIFSFSDQARVSVPASGMQSRGKASALYVPFVAGAAAAMQCQGYAALTDTHSYTI